MATNRPLSAEDARRTNKLRAWLQVYRLSEPTDELLAEWVERLKGLSPQEFDIGLEKAARENARPGFAPDPRTVLDIASEMRSGASYNDRECTICKGTGYEVRQTAQGRVAVVCRCVDESTRQKIEEEFGKPLYHSAKSFARQERRRLAAHSRIRP